jgi:hypothetical protein
MFLFPDIISQRAKKGERTFFKKKYALLISYPLPAINFTLNVNKVPGQTIEFLFGNGCKHLNDLPAKLDYKQITLLAGGLFVIYH